MDTSSHNSGSNFDALRQLREFLQTDTSSNTEGSSELVRELIRVSLAGINLDQRELLAILRLSIESTEWLGVLHNLTSDYSIAPNYIRLHQNDKVEFNSAAKWHRAFTLQTWLRVNNEDDEDEDISLKMIGLTQNLMLSIAHNRLVIELIDESHSERQAGTFDSFTFESNLLYHLTLTISPVVSKRGVKINLYIDGEFVESIQLDLDVTSAPNSSNTLPISIMNNSTSNKTIDFVNLLVISQVQPLEWILLSYFLSAHYAGNYRDNNLTEALSYKAKSAFELKLKELYIHTALSKDENENGQQYKFEDFTRQELLKFEHIHNMLVKSDKLNLADTSIILAFTAKHSYMQAEQVVVPYNGTQKAVTSQTLSLEQSMPIHSVFYSVGGVAIAFKIIESVSTNDALCISLDTLFELIANDWRNLKEFEARNGYDILATLLKTKKHLIDLKVLDTILKFIGYDYNSPVDSILINALAYRSLILDFDIWKLDGDNSSANKETFKFLLFQFTVFFQESKYNLYNINKLVKMRVIKRFIQALKFESFGKDMLPVVHSSLLILIKANPSAEIMKSLSAYIIYALSKDTSKNEESLQRQCGICALDVLVSYICDSSLINSSLSSASGSNIANVGQFYKKLAKTISVRWVLLLLSDPNPRVVKLSLRLLIRMLSISGPRYYNNFMQHNGLDVMTSSLERWWDDSEVIIILFSGAFGISQVQELGTDLAQFANRLSKRGSRLTIVMPDFLYLINNLLLHGIDIAEGVGSSSADYEDVTFNLASSLNSFVESFEITYENVPCLNTFYSKDQTWITGYLRILSRLEALPTEATSSEILSSKMCLIERFSNFTIELLFKEAVGGVKFDQFFKSIKKQSQDLTILHILIFPHVLDHLVNFKDMLPDLYFSQKWLKSNILKFVDQFSEFLATYVHVIQVYFEFTKVLAVLIEISSEKKLEENDLIKLRQLAGDCFLKEYQVAKHASHLIRLTKELLFRQELYFHPDTLPNKKLADLAVGIFHSCQTYDDHELHTISINALRMLILCRQDDLDRLAEVIQPRDPSALKSFLDELLSSNDDDIIKRTNDPAVFKLFESKTLKHQLKDPSIELVAINKSHSHISDAKAVKNFDLDNSKWKTAISSSESTKFHRHIQDYEDNLQFYITVYNKMRQESTRYLYGSAQLEFKWVVDSIECDSRMRRRIVPDFSSNYSQLMSLTAAPKPRDSVSETASVRPRMNSAARSSSITSLELEESFEFVEDPGEVEAIQEDKNRKVLRSLYIGDTIVDLWNISQIIGLESVESILILGNTHLYIVENYFHSTNGEIMDIEDAPIEERDPYMQLILGPNQRSVRDKRSKTTKTWDLEKLTSVSKRQFLLRDVALEFFFSDGSSFLVTCLHHKMRDNIYSKLSYLATRKGVDADLSQALKLATSSSLLNGNGAPKLFGFSISNAFSNHNISSLPTTKKWQRGEISNFYYLIIINTLAGRTFNDLTQYPVFPWVIADYTSEELDLNDPQTYRDLSKPMGGQASQRESTFIERYEALASLNDPDAPPFHYGTHYSSAMIVTHFLIRLEPYVQSYLLLQGGRFDHADRLFYSVAKAWNSAAKENTTDVRELIPEFFYLPEFLENSNDYDFGTLQHGETIGNVELPPWAKGDPNIFIQKNREALESPYVSSHLHEWIDLIFGFKQTGKAAVDATNVFHHLSYNGAIDLDKIEDEVERRAMTGIIHNFGQTPLQLFNKPHPAREVLSYPRLDMDSIPASPSSVTESKSKQSVKTLELGTKDKIWKGRPPVFSNEDNICIRNSSTIGSLFINGDIYEELHTTAINVLSPFGQKLFLTGSQDGTIHVWKYVVRSNLTSGNVTLARREAVGNFLDLKRDTFEFQAALRGHLSSVIDIHIAPSFNSALSLDDSGEVFLWDLVRFAITRKLNVSCIEGKIIHISIANDTGNVVVATETKFSLLSINGEVIFTGTLPEGETDYRINSIEFAQSNWLLPKYGSTVHHEYWQRSCIIAVGTTNKVHVVELLVHEGSWQSKSLKTFETNFEEQRKITAVKLILLAESDEEGRKIGKGKLISGDEKGKVVVWG